MHMKKSQIRQIYSESIIKKKKDAINGRIECTFKLHSGYEHLFTESNNVAYSQRTITNFGKLRLPYSITQSIKHIMQSV
jgi:hypothetical protein